MKHSEEAQESAEMKSEYDFTGKTGSRGKYYKEYRKGHVVRILGDDD